MSLHVLFNGRKKAIPCQANTTMQSVLVAACAEHGLSPEAATRYTLTHKKASIDLSQPFRFTGIPNNATVDLTEAASTGGGGGGGAGCGGSEVRIGLQVPGGQRLTESFAPSQSLAEVIAYWVQEKGQLDPAFAAPGAPVSVVYLRQAFEGQAVLAQTTLRSMGLNGGSALLNLRLVSPPAKASPYALGGGGGSGGLRGGVEESKPSAKAASLPPPPPPPPPLQPSAAPERRKHEESGGGGEEMSTSLSSSSGMDVVAAGDDAPASSSSSSSRDRLAEAEAALEELSSTHFDTDVKETVGLLAKYIDNIVGRPDNPKTRAIKCSNAHFQAKIDPRRGALSFLLALGFKEETQGGLSHEIAANPSAYTYLILPPTSEDTSLLLRARRLLFTLAQTLELDLGPPPSPSSTVSHPPTHPPAFDPYRPAFVSMSMTVGREHRGPSITERKLAELKQKQEAIQSTLPPRHIQIFPPSSSSSSSSVGGGGGGGGWEESFPLNNDMQQIAKSVAAKMAQKKREEDAPFRTKAQRELEALEKAKVYPHTLLRLQCPDR